MNLSYNKSAWGKTLKEKKKKSSIALGIDVFLKKLPFPNILQKQHKVIKLEIHINFSKQVQSSDTQIPHYTYDTHINMVHYGPGIQKIQLGYREDTAFLHFMGKKGEIHLKLDGSCEFHPKSPDCLHLIFL